MLIYLVTNNINGKVYVGKLSHKKNLWNYWAENVAKAMKGRTSKPYLYNAIRKYKAENFSVQQIEKCKTHEKLCAAEKKWVKHYDSNNSNKGYNLTEGGEGGWGHTVSPAVRKRIGDSHRGKPLSEEHKQKLRERKLKNPTNYWLGKKRPNAFGGVDKMFNTKGMKVVYVNGHRKYITKEEYEKHSVW